MSYLVSVCSWSKALLTSLLRVVKTWLAPAAYVAAATQVQVPDARFIPVVPARPLLSFFLTSSVHDADHGQGVATKQRHEKVSANTHSKQVSPAAVSSSRAKSSECSMQEAVTMPRLHQPAESQSAAHQTAAPDSRKRLASELPHSDKRRQSHQVAALPMSHSVRAQEDPSGSVTADNASDRDSDTDDEPEVPH